MRTFIVSILLALTAPAWAADGPADRITDGDTLVLGETTFRFDGIDAPEIDQGCLDESGAMWPCGIEARDRLTELTAKRAVHCDDLGLDPVYSRFNTVNPRHIGICSVGGETTTLNEQLVREGWAVDFERYSNGRFKAAEDEARVNHRGLWKGCFVAPQDFRHWNKRTAKLLGTTCPAGDDSDVRNKLFQDVPPPPGCSIKGKISLRAQLTGHIGIYHMEGCRHYRRTKSPNRWFCSEDEARADGFRKAFDCGRKA